MNFQIAARGGAHNRSPSNQRHRRPLHGPHKHGAPEDSQRNDGGRLLEAGLGANLLFGDYRQGAEWLPPLRQQLKGEQLGKDRGVSLSLSRSG